MLDLRVTGIRLADSDGDRHSRIVARFDCDLGLVRVRSCLLRVDEGGTPMVDLPRCSYRHASFRFDSHETRLKLRDAAVAAFQALGGVLPADDA
jgi:hypothetical protein